jgi:SAM-dependent methyltransferase
MVSQKRAIEANRRRWNAMVPVHFRSRYYAVDEFMMGKSSLRSTELDEVGNPRGKDLLHLQCHFGMDTISWARMGARATGVDFSPEAIDVAKKLSKELKVPASFVCCDVYKLPGRFKGAFDIVYTSYGVLCWLPDRVRWARAVARCLRPGGSFHLIESHPFTQLLDQEARRPALEPHGRYFNDGKPSSSVTPWSYTDGQLSKRMIEYEWPFSMSEIVNTVADAGLRVEYVHEFPYEHWRSLPWLAEGKDGNWYPRDPKVRLPLMFSLKATKPR